MSVPVRQALALLVLAVALIARVQQPGPFLPGGDPEPFPETVDAQAGPTPNVHAGRPEVRVYQLLDSMNAMWSRAFEAAGDEYERPTMESRDAEHGCGSLPGGNWAGRYCRTGERIVIDFRDHTVARAAVGDDGADDRLGYVLAHEVGHHVQHLRGLDGRETQEEIVRAELHAECLAGVWGRAAGRRPPPGWTYQGDGDHGTAIQQQQWLERGHARGRPADCDAVWD